MTIYIITKGNGLKYHICTATDDKGMAEKLKELFSGDGQEAKIEEFDSSVFVGVFDYGYKPFFITATYDAAIVRAEEEPEIDDTHKYNHITKNSFGNYVCRVVAKDAEHAKRNYLNLFQWYQRRLECGEITE